MALVSWSAQLTANLGSALPIKVEEDTGVDSFVEEGHDVSRVTVILKNPCR